jgi:hypothetical protein
MYKHCSLILSIFCSLVVPIPALANNPHSPRKTVTCTGNQFQDWFHVTRISDGKEFGDFGEKLSFKVCQQAVAASTPELVCTGNQFQDWFYATRISDGQQLGNFGEKLSFKVCQQVVRASNPELVCIGIESQDWFSVTKISDGNKLNNFLSLENCLHLTNTSWQP